MPMTYATASIYDALNINSLRVAYVGSVDGAVDVDICQDEIFIELINFSIPKCIEMAGSRDHAGKSARIDDAAFSQCDATRTNKD